jgi:hypothetical protein
MKWEPTVFSIDLWIIYVVLHDNRVYKTAWSRERVVTARARSWAPWAPCQLCYCLLQTSSSDPIRWYVQTNLNTHLFHVANLNSQRIKLMLALSDKDISIQLAKLLALLLHAFMACVRLAVILSPGSRCPRPCRSHPTHKLSSPSLTLAAPPPQLYLWWLNTREVGEAINMH